MFFYGGGPERNNAPSFGNHPNLLNSQGKSTMSAAVLFDFGVLSPGRTGNGRPASDSNLTGHGPVAF
jgi:hypothetical protein